MIISEGYATKPILSEPFPNNRKIWTCPKTGLIIPKRHEEHMEWREKLLKKASNDTAMQTDLLAACRDSLLFWVNAFAWTKHEFETDPDTGKQTPSTNTHWPFNTWEIQDGAFDFIESCFNEGEDGLFDKSREMGASWICLTFNHWLWLFRPDTQIREMSRIEDLVDSPLPKSLFAKHDYINMWLPEWMRPPGISVRGKDNRTKLRIHNELNNSDIGGEATTQHAMRADRCAIILLDEFSQVDNGEQIRTSTTAVAPCRIINSTTIGAGTSYAKWKNDPNIKIRVFSLKFWDHPDKGKGRFVLQDDVTKRYEISSPYIERKKLRCGVKELAQEEYGVDLKAGDTFFSLGEIDRHIMMHAKLPTACYNIDLKKGIANDQIPKIIQQRDIKCYALSKPGKGKLEVWGKLIDGRPDQSKTYIFGIDTSKGQGASESVVSIKCKQSGEIIAKWKCRLTPPYEFARVIVALSLWCGGSAPQRLPYLKWENNGPGWDLGRLLVQDFRYPHYYRAKSVGTVIEKVGTKYGYQTSRPSKVLLLRAYEQALLQNRTINHDRRGLEQAKYYIYYTNGGVGPADLQDKKLAEQLLHGDIVIADALTTEDREVGTPKKKGKETPHGSWGDRFERWKKKKAVRKGWRQPYNFGG